MSKQLYKYIIVDGGAILFPEAVVHIQVAHGFMELKQKVYSAGFCVIEYSGNGDVKVECHGESTSLNLESQPLTDSRVIAASLFSIFNPYKFGTRTIKDEYEQ